MDNSLQIKRMERDILDNEVSFMLMQFEKEILDRVSGSDKTPDHDSWARRIVAHVREQIT